MRERGPAGRGDLPRMRVYTSAHSHSSIDKAAITLGIGHENVVHVPVDDAFRASEQLLSPDNGDAPGRRSSNCDNRRSSPVARCNL